jgi:hypothetical protein
VGNLALLRCPRTESSGKLESKWEGSYIIMKKTMLGPYRLADPQGPKLEHAWNADNLRRFYISVTCKGAGHIKEPPPLDFISCIYFLRAPPLFLIGEARESIRFLMRWSPCNPEAIITSNSSSVFDKSWCAR